MDAVLRLLNTLLPVLYAVAAVNYSVDFFRDDPFARKLARPLLAGAIVFHALYLALRTVRNGHVPIATPAEVMTTVAFSVAVVYAWVEFRTRTHKTGMFLIAFSAVFQAAASAFLSPASELPDVLRSPLFGVHTVSAVLGYTAFAVSAIYGILFLVFYHELKSRRLGVVYRRLPSLDVLSRMSLRASALGVVFLAATITFGAMWAAQRFPGFQRDPKFLLTLGVWCVYAAGLGLHYALGWGGRRLVYVFLVGFSLILLSAAVARFWLPSFHGFA